MLKFLCINNIRKFIEVRPITTKITADGKDVPKKKSFESRVTLINSDNTVSITELKNAQSLATRRDLKLVKIQDVDSKTRRPVYKLMTNAEYHQEELQKRKDKLTTRGSNIVKGEKLLTMSTRIGEHDLMTGVNKMIKLLQKHYEVRVVITGDSEGQVQKSENMYSIIEKNIKSIARVVQKRVKGNALKFQLLPLKESSSQATSSSSDQDGNDKGPL